MMRKIYLGADHGGFDLKEKIKKELILWSGELHLEVEDLGSFDTESVDYPDYASAVCERLRGFQVLSSSEPSVSLPHEVGLLICGSGQGMAMRANKYSHIRAALCWNKESTLLSREHNDANILCLGGRLLDHELALEMTRVFLTTPFAGGRHQRRVLKIGESTST